MHTLSSTNNKKINIYNNVISIDNFEAIYKRYAEKVYQKCLSMTKDPEVAKDFTQDIFIKVFCKLDTFQNRSAFLTWLYSVSHNYCLDQLRLSKRMNTEPLLENYAQEVIEPDQIDPFLTQWRVLEQAMNTIPSEEATLLRLKHEQGLSIKLIGEQYQISESAVKMRLKRSRDKVCKVYNQQMCRTL
ncbi:RNA polymerase sigma factor [Spirosoma validum]|uniref:RNA polymerase sigma factor n=1 Tax=Spirosoma validum TaxID=2771355 RepID=A0A927B3S4_9BACT|nr:RNA polymerase sigma factor [Spirosoma validum]MBD2754712.1 RNA polymerase sigma factor [Spirosoma validum]